MAHRRGAVTGAGLSVGAAHYYARIYGPARAGCLAGLRRAGCTEEEAEEIFATTLERIMGKFDPTDSPYAPAQMVSLLKKACQQKLIDERRHRSVLRMVPLEEAAGHADVAADSPAEAAERHEAVAIGREAIDSLPERDRHLFLQRHQLHLSPEEILRRNPGLSRRTYRKLIQRANARALKTFEEIDSGERCKQMRSEYMRRYVAGEASERELKMVGLHLRSCRSCRLRAAQMRTHLHDVASGLAAALVAGGARRGHLADWMARALDAASERGQALAEATRHARERLRELGLRTPLGSPGSGGDTVAGQIAGLSVAKAVPICATGALAVGCLAAGIAPSLDVSRTPEPHRPAVSREAASRTFGAGSTATAPYAPTVTPAPSTTASDSAGDRRAGSRQEVPPARRPRKLGSPSSDSASTPAQQAGVEFGGDSTGAGQPYTPLPPAPAAETEEEASAGTGGQVNRSRSAGAAPRSSSQGGSEFGM